VQRRSVHRRCAFTHSYRYHRPGRRSGRVSRPSWRAGRRRSSRKRQGELRAVKCTADAKDQCRSRYSGKPLAEAVRTAIKNSASVSSSSSAYRGSALSERRSGIERSYRSETTAISPPLRSRHPVPSGNPTPRFLASDVRGAAFAPPQMLQERASPAGILHMLIPVPSDLLRTKARIHRGKTPRPRSGPSIPTNS